MKKMTDMVRSWVLISIFLLSAVSQNAFVQAQSSTLLTLTEAIQTALKKNPKISAASSQIEISEANIVMAKSGLIPQINFRESYSRTTNPMWAFGTRLNQEVIAQQDFDPARLNNPDSIDNFASVISANWSLFDSGRTWHGLRQAKLAKETASLGLERTRQQIIAQTVIAYAGLLLANENLSTINQTLSTARSHLKMVKSRFESGFIVKSDFLRAQVHIAELEQQQLQAESQIQVARAFLNSVMGVPIDSQFELISLIQTENEIEGPLDKWLDLALTQRSDLKQFQFRESIAQEEITKSRSARLPSVNLVGNYEFNTEDFSDGGENYTVGAILNVNLFSGNRLTAKTTQAKAALKQVNAEKTSLKTGILVQIQQAFLQAQSAKKRIRVARAAVSQAEEALRIVRNRYNSGLLAIVALLDAELALQRARTNHFRSIHDYKIATTQLVFAAGTIDENFK